MRMSDDEDVRLHIGGGCGRRAPPSKGVREMHESTARVNRRVHPFSHSISLSLSLLPLFTAAVLLLSATVKLDSNRFSSLAVSFFMAPRACWSSQFHHAAVWCCSCHCTVHRSRLTRWTQCSERPFRATTAACLTALPHC